MKKILVCAAIAAVAVGFCSCAGNEFDDQMEARSVMNKGAKTEKTEVKSNAKGKDKNERNGIMLCAPVKTKEAKASKEPFAKGPDKNAKNGVMPIATRCAEAEDGPIRRPLGDTWGQYNCDGPTKKIKK